jgi:hypothetical protein
MKKIDLLLNEMPTRSIRGIRFKLQVTENIVPYTSTAAGLSSHLPSSTEASPGSCIDLPGDGAYSPLGADVATALGRPTNPGRGPPPGPLAHPASTPSPADLRRRDT